MRSRLALAAGAVLLVLAGSFALWGGGAPPAIRIGITSRPPHELLLLAAERKLFEREGAPVQLLEFPSVVDARRAYERNQIDGLVGTLVELTHLQAERERRPVAFAVVGVSTGADVLLAHSGVGSIADLRGRRVGLELDTSAELVLARALASAGLGPGDVQRVHVQPENAPGALARREVDAIVAHPPASVLAEQEGAVHLLFSSASMPGEIPDLLLIDPALLGERTGEAAGILRAIERAVHRTRGSASAAHRLYQLMGRSEGLSAGEMREAFEGGFTLPAPAEQATLLAPGGPLARELRRVAQALQRLGGERAFAAPDDRSLTPTVAERAARG